MPARWEIAHEERECIRRGCVIGQGETYRIGKVGPWCEDCSVALDGQSAPEHIQNRDFLSRLRDEMVQHAPADNEPVFQRFDGSAVGAELRGNILEHRKASAHTVTPGRQPSVDPRGQNSGRRHGVVEAMRHSTETDWHARARRAGRGRK
jgi:hypothetical protein